ncbi:pentatricopeptide repeat-containing protein At5g04780, mitochondrial-like [Selaginella moellendorffii]|uniref:pentatricopeptide repeat-containing protein At5g04780, mitochondrial-like n=1 Tax=Selaginella moellendorffii TaxID=88036 RepID=UPI000D1C5717|nr:pentatricopeptide repeat-containing protein At5g04780, mitochondrial-like [Selaginella moellendorffii]|eukprot:XP_024526508.1 pentatricopeptide repeat-containing protein At5g04780, mitochondrial-like [Selaginella moellendorffii]
MEIRAPGAAQALEIYVEARAAGKMPTASQVIAAFKACGSLNRLDTGREIHAQLLQESVVMVHRNTCVATALVDMYAKCGSLGEAIQIFQTMQCRRSVVTWNCIILGCAHAGDFHQALELYSRMDCPPNHVTFLAALKACIGVAGEEEKVKKEEGGGGVERIQCLGKIRVLHREATREMVSGIHIFVANSLITAYSKCGSLREALDVFQGMKEHSVVSWTEIIMAYAGNGGGKMALQLYDQMLEQGFFPSRVTLLAALKACCCSSVTEEGADKTW